VRSNPMSTKDKSGDEQQQDGHGSIAKAIIEYEAPWPIYALNMCAGENQSFRLAIGSFLEEYANKVEVVQYDPEKQKFASRGVVDHPYPTTKIMWNPSAAGGDMFATTGDYLRLWNCSEPGAPKMVSLLNNHKNTPFCAPLTSFDWNEKEPSLLGTSSIDTTCTIWNVTTGQSVASLIAHDSEVFDIAFSSHPSIFGSVGNDGSVRLFDLRALQSSTIVFERTPQIPLLRLAWNKQDPNFLAVLPLDADSTVILDMRSSVYPVANLGGHSSTINACAWAPHSSAHIATVADDSQALIWDLSALPEPVTEAKFLYKAPECINNLHWSPQTPHWLAIGFARKLQILSV